MDTATGLTSYDPYSRRTLRSCVAERRDVAAGPACLLLVFCCLPLFAGIESRLVLPPEFESQRITYRAAVSRETETEVARMDGAGCLRHFWMTAGDILTKPENGLNLTLRIYVDGNRVPAVEVPAAPFFGIHHGHAAKHLNSPNIQVTDLGGFNSYFLMPYAKGMRMTLQSNSANAIGVWFQADYHSYPPGSFREALRFHAAYRRVNPAQSYGRPFHAGHGEGEGFLAGITLGVRVFDPADFWYHCGGDIVLLDGRRKSAHLLHGIGGEDFFGTAWGQQVFSNGSIGTPYYDENPKPNAGDPSLWFAAYRFFDKDPIVFKDSFSFDFGSLANDMSSVLYWYQKGTAKPTVRLPSNEDRSAAARVPDGKYDLDRPAVRTWKLCGPFSCASKAEFDRPEFPELGVNTAESRPADFGQYAKAVTRGWGTPVLTRWIDSVRSMFNFVDVTPHFRSRMKTNGGLPVDVSAYAFTEVSSDTAVPFVMRIGHDDWIRVWQNGKVIYEGAEQRGFRTAEVPVRLARGQNRFLVKAANRENTNYRAWVFLFDLAPLPATR